MSTSSNQAPVSRDGAATTATGPSGVGGPARAAAMGLWVLVSAGLLYGVTQTVIRAAQLF